MHSGSRLRSFELGNLGYLELIHNNPSRALILLEESLDLTRRSRYKRGRAWAQQNIALTLLVMEEFERARDTLREMLQWIADVDLRELLPPWLEGVALILVSDARAEIAGRLLGAADGVRQSLGAIHEPVERRIQQRAVADVSARLGSDGFRRRVVIRVRPVG